MAVEPSHLALIRDSTTVLVTGGGQRVGRPST